MVGACLELSAAEPGRPNIVMIISDDQAWTDYSFMGHPQIRTPNLDRLAAEGLVFRQGHVPSSLCSPSLASKYTTPPAGSVMGASRSGLPVRACTPYQSSQDVIT